MNMFNKIVFNLNHKKDLHKAGGMDAVTMYYLFKILFPNSIIYNTSVKLLYQRLKIAKIISRNFKYKRFTDAFDVLLKKEYIEFDHENQHYILKSVHENKGFYKSQISYTKGNTTWTDIVEAVIKEELKHTKLRQEKGMNLRSKMTATKKAYNLLKRLIKKGMFDRYSGESFTDGILFSYRGIAKTTSLSIRTVHKHIRNLAAKKQIDIITVKEVNEKLSCSLDLINDVIDCYCYVDRQGRLVKVFGTRLLSV